MSLGLIPGDLITNINGESLQDTQKAIAIFQNLEKDTQVALTIIRNNSPQEIVIKSNQFISNN
jgi:type II secretory pathway component PulC